MGAVTRSDRGITVHLRSMVRNGKQVAVREQVVLFSRGLRVQFHRGGATELGQSLAVGSCQNSHKV